MVALRNLGKAVKFTVAVAAMTAVMGLFTYVMPAVGVIEKWFDDLRLSLLTPTQEHNGDIIVAAISESTLARFPYRSPIDRQFLADLVNSMADKGVKAVGLDILFDQGTEPEKDAALRSALENFPGPVVVSWGDDRAGVTEEQTAFMADYLANVQKGFANVIKDRDGIVRRVFAGGNVGDGFRHGFVLELAKALGHDVPNKTVPLAYSGRTEDGSDPIVVMPSERVSLLPKTWLEGKVVLVGAVLPQRDRHLTPFATAFGAGYGNMPGVVIHAHVLAQVLENRSLSPLPWYAALALIAAISAGALALAIASMRVWYKILIGVAATIALWSASAWVFSEFSILTPIVAPTLALFGMGGLGIAYLAQRTNQEKRFIRDAFARYLSVSVIRQLESDPERLQLGGERREMTFIFTDIAGFTSLSESTPPSVLVPALNTYLDGICQILIDHRATIDKFVGDAVVAFFNAPVEQADHPQRAVACALEMSAFAEKFAKEQNAAGVEFGMTRIGVNTGTVTVGNFGGDIRFEYTAIGDSMNTAARLESANKTLGTNVCVSGATMEKCDGIPFRPVGNIVLKGKTEGVPVYEPVTTECANSQQFKDYMEAYTDLRATNDLPCSSDLDPAIIQKFIALTEAYPDDTLARLHLERVKRGEKGIRIVMETK